VKAAVLHGREDVRIEQIEPRPLGAGEVRLRIEAALTCGTDLKVFKRGYHACMIVPPAVFGHEMAGTLAEVAPNVQSWRVGDREDVARRAEKEAQGVAIELKAQATRRERAKKLLDPRLLFSRAQRPSAAATSERAA
jgi:NADPH:quinone reductase-like Zn-dependent oxidoreductase